ncbi:MAG TPA: UDP-N-acetylglucosamine 2-epimerase (non-hydrolyzing) [Thermoanaerobaculia bacterium]|nr:UDP-N-acetylglucosamine 2-epimerase (non-hydrolyzing) [Thermoanaerobaculia bacterium]
MLKVLTVVGARPQFIKAAPVSRALAAAGCEEVLVHTGQHYDHAMSDVFFTALGVKDPKYDLGIGSASHGAQTGRMLEAIEQVVLDERPDVVLVYGDTNSTLAGALAAVKLHVPVAHVEAGLRSFNRRMPEEINRVMTDHIAALLFAPTERAVENLRAEGIVGNVVRTGDVMLDAVTIFRGNIGREAERVLERFGVKPRQFVLLTTHRAENTDDPERWSSIMRAVERVSKEVAPVLWPVHPRVRELQKPASGNGVVLVEPQPYFETQALLMNAKVVLTDSGGLQKEAAFHAVPCVTLRDETEWIELVEHGVNRLAGADEELIVRLAAEARWPEAGLPAHLYGAGDSAAEIVRALARFGGEAS